VGGNILTPLSINPKTPSISEGVFFGSFPKQVDGNENPFGSSKGEKKVECEGKKAKRFFIFPICKFA